MDSPESPLVSVITPAYNAERTVGAAISGALSQHYPAVEVVVVDDGSKDRTRAICEAYGDAITFASVPNGGTASARNAAIERARGEYVALCDSDDILLPSHIDVMMRTLQEAGGGRRFVCGNAYLMTSAGVAHGRTVMNREVPPPDKQRIGILQDNFVPIFSLMPRRMLTELGGFREDRYLEDWDLWIRAVFAGWEVVKQPVPHALYREGQPSKSTDKTTVYDAETAILRHLLESTDVDLRDEEREYLALRLAGKSPRQLIEEAEDRLRCGDHHGARELYAQAVRLWPDNRKLTLKSRSLRVPGVARLWQRRLAGIDAGLGRAGAETT